MPSVDENRSQWSNHDWSTAGDEWSVGYGGTDTMWAWTIMPRIAGLLPADHILEIAPGFGRVTQYLAPACNKLTVVDLTERCIDACKERFADLEHIEYHVNDGRSLDMVADNSVDLVFSWDSLIHVEEDVIAAYLDQLGRKLKPGAAGVLHHSNLGSYRDKTSGELTIENEHWRASTMSAQKFQELCRAAGLRCLNQELIPWGGPNFTDCISVFRRERTPMMGKTKVFPNDRFFIQVQKRLADEIREVAKDYPKG
jgi:ubiquinone/menaquinone biosynthesis C-methylase UbiE